MTTEPQTVPSNKNLSPNNLWRRRVRIAFLLGLLGLAFAPFAIRQWHLARIPEIAEPFDVDVFSNPKVAASENAFQHYHAARHQYVSKQLREKEKFPVSNFLAVRVHGWSEASPRLRKWIDDRREALVSWKRGTECQDALYHRPSDLDATTDFPVVTTLLEMGWIASCEAARLESEEKFDEALEWYFAIQRCSRHVYQYAGIDQRQIGWTLHAIFFDGLLRWLQHPEIESEQLLHALKQIQEVDKSTIPLSTVLKTEYVIAKNTFSRPDWIRTTGLADSVESSSHVDMGMKLYYWMFAEPQSTQKILRHVLTNQLNQVDRPYSSRQPFAYSSLTMLFENPAESGNSNSKTNPQSINQHIDQSLVARNTLTPRINNLETAFQIERARQTLLQIVLAAEAYRRKLGSFPNDTQTFVPHYLSAWPADPWDREGLPMRFVKHTSESILIWSVGENGSDENGDVAGRRVSRDTVEPYDFGMVLHSR